MSCTNVPNATLAENSFYVGVNLQGILYGIQLGLYFKTIYVLLVRRRDPWKSDVFYAVFSSAMLSLITIRVVTGGIYGEKIWLADRDYPSRPLAYGEAHAPNVYTDLEAWVVIVLQQMIHAFMMYRCRVVWDNLGVLVAPSSLWLANLALGILASWAADTPRIGLLGDISVKLGLAYTAISVFLNIMLTCMIWYRLACHARTAKICHAEEDVALHLTTETLAVESMLPYTLCGIALLIAFSVQREIAFAFSGVYALMMCISPQWLTLVVVDGKAWRRDSLRTCSGHGDVAERSDGDGGVALVVFTSRDAAAV